jgi:hypothetical protein
MLMCADGRIDGISHGNDRTVTMVDEEGERDTEREERREKRQLALVRSVCV